MVNGSNWIKSLVLALGLISSTAIAHVHLAQTVPPRESEVSMAPEMLSLTFYTAPKIREWQCDRD